MDKLSKTLLREMISRGGSVEYFCSFDEEWKIQDGCSLDELALKFGQETENLKACVRELERNEYLEYQSAGPANVGFCLSYKGLNWKYYRRKEILSYIADKWIDFFSLLLSVSALLVSIIALLLKQ